MLSGIDGCVWRRRYSKLVVGSVLFLIFAGGMVTSTGSGLAVPDWPLSYGMLFPPMVGGVFYEHGHRMVASVVGLLTLIQAIWLGQTESRSWVRKLGYASLLVVITQGLLGGITVLFFLPKPVSISHAVLAQTFFILTIIIAYSQSNERVDREKAIEPKHSRILTGIVMAGVSAIYIQLILGALMRHTGSGLAIPDFPKMAGTWIPHFDEVSLAYVNTWRFQHGLNEVTLTQMVFHSLHRLGALVVLFVILASNVVICRWKMISRRLKSTLFILDGLILVQVTLGAVTIWSGKAPVLTSFHVVTGAACLGISTLLLLRALPLKLRSS